MLTYETLNCRANIGPLSLEICFVKMNYRQFCWGYRKTASQSITASIYANALCEIMNAISHALLLQVVGRRDDFGQRRGVGAGDDSVC